MFPIHGTPDDRTRDAMLHHAAKLESLAADLRRIASGDGPIPSELMAAPILNEWRIDVRPDPCLVGIGAAHPRLLDGPVTTSGLWVVDVGAGWARTYSRYYVLGEQGTVEPDRSPASPDQPADRSTTASP